MKLWVRLWAAPASLIGLVLGLFFARRSIVRGVLLCEGAHWPRRLGWRHTAITFGHVVLSVSDPLPAPILHHELVHVRQYECCGILLLPLYLAGSVAALLRGRRPYLDNPFEVQARLQAASFSS